MRNVGAFTKSGLFGMNKLYVPLFQEDKPDTLWAGVTNQYFSSIIAPFEATGTAGWAKRFEVDKQLRRLAGEDR